MILDSLLRAPLAREMTASLAGTAVRRAHQPDADTLILTLRGRGGEQRLLASAHPRRPRVHLTRARPANPRVPPPFCMLVRKHLVGRPFAGARAEPGLPVITLRFGARPRGADDAVLLAVEMTGHAATVVLMLETAGETREAPAILGLLRPLPAARRALAPGAAYTPPILAGRLDPQTASADALAETTDRLLAGKKAGRAVGLARLLSRAFEGVGRRMAAAALARADIVKTEVSPGDADAGLSRPEAAAFLSALRALLRTPCDPRLLSDAEGRPAELLPFPMGNAPHPARPVPNLSEALDLLCLGKDSGEALAAARRGALRALAALITHRTRKLERQRADLGRAAEGERWRAQADLLLAQGNSARRGLASLVVADVFDESAPEVTILLDPAMTLAENAGRLYKRAQKAKRGLARLAQVIARGEAELRYLREQKLHAELAEDRETLDAIAASLGKKAKRAPARARGEKARVRGAAQEGGGGPRRFSLRGWEVIVGRHGRDNDQIVTRIGSPRDLWFHARGVPGAHVLLRRPGRDSPDARVQESAARIAAHYSQARGDARADVIVADLKQVRKPRGMPPGQVMVRESRTLRVAPGLPAGLAPLGGNDHPASGGATGRRRGSGAR